MVKRFTVFLSALLIAFAAFAGCTKDSIKGAKLIEKGERLVVIEATETGGSLEDALAKFKEEKLLDYESAMGDYGLYVKKLNGYTLENNEFVAIYTSLSEYDGIAYSNTDWGTYEYNGKTYDSATYGASGLPLIKGEIYILAISTY